LLLLAALLFLCGGNDAASAATTVDFQKDIEPILTANCHKCHGADKQKSGLRLDSPAAALKGGDSGPAIQPGKSADSRLVQLVAGLDPEKVMPPKGDRLTAAQVTLLRVWIDQGATWPETGTAPQRSTHWAFQPITKPTPPSIANHQPPVTNPIDAFILARLEKSGLQPSPGADRATLIRRLTYDLTGLPPTPEEVNAFVRDRSANAYERVVDRLLASPRYGERWGRHWLDVARYTESQGFEYDHMRENAWHYRDYVIRAFNDDKPYDRFMREQIAGDVIEPVTGDGIIATSLLVCGAWDQAGSSQANIAQRMTTREEEMEDLLSVVGQGFLGLTLNCARCHSHKFDPIPQEEYFRVKSVFDGVRHGERVIATSAEIAAHGQQLAKLQEQIGALEKEVAEVESAGRTRVLADRKHRTPVANRGSELPSGSDIPVPMARWSFEGDARDSQGTLHGTLRDGAQIVGGRLRLNGSGAFVETAPLARPLREKTLEAWVALARLDQGGGSALTVEMAGGSVFDAIVFGEREPKKWTSGSEDFERTKNLDTGSETAAPGELTHMAIVYNADNSIALFRNGQPYGKPYTPGNELQTYQGGDARVLIGKRHTGAGRAFLAGEIEEAALYDRALTARQIAASFARAGWSVALDETVAALTPAERARRDTALSRLENTRGELKALPPLPVSYAGKRQQPEPTHRLKRGDVRTPEAVVAPGALSVVSGPSVEFGLPPDAPEAERRKKFAEWLGDPRNPLPARVMVNRVWQHHFGVGLVSTPNDLGMSGSKPSHPELLDWLASEFIAHHWSVKALHRRIVTSATYRQSSAMNAQAASGDADNQLLWRFTPQRLEAEAVRDAMLAVSGELNPEMGGPSFRPFDTKSFNATFYFPADKTGPEFNRRTVYRMNVNSGKDPLLEAFDCPDPSAKTPRRGVTTTPLQALGLMNNSFVQRQAGLLAERVLAEAHGDESEAIRHAYRRCFAREPAEGELREARAAAHATDLQNVCWALLNATEFVFVR
jgi:mono/diheme cytochrome c family protein